MKGGGGGPENDWWWREGQKLWIGNIPKYLAEREAMDELRFAGIRAVNLKLRHGQTDRSFYVGISMNTFYVITLVLLGESF